MELSPDTMVPSSWDFKERDLELAKTTSYQDIIGLKWIS